jgi:Cu+-exporting ATPase
MPEVLLKPNTKKAVSAIEANSTCFHCGATCISNAIAIDDKLFCCEGCKLVYEIIEANGLCDYYRIQNHPGLTQIKEIRNDKYAFLDNETIAQKLLKFTNGNYTIVTLYLPGVHCSSCMWLIEHLNRLHEGVIESRLNFTTKEVTIHYRREGISLRKIVELLATIGYEPYISLDDTFKGKTNDFNKRRIFKLGVAGFCFGNIMMLSFPEYLSGNVEIEYQYAQLFRILNLVLSLPVFFYSASEFFTSTWAGLKQKILNIDAPIALALLITFARSLYEILSGNGSGYLDSMSGIVFFMLVGRVLQERTNKSLSFHRDYKAYFPIAVNVVTPGGIETRSLHELKQNDLVELFNDEIIPADATVVSGIARIDYSFVTGESDPVVVNRGDIVYAGGRQKGERLQIRIQKPVAGSYLTSLWNHHAFSRNKVETNKAKSIIHLLAKYFTIILFLLAAITATYWAVKNPSNILPSVSAMLIVACPCALLLSATYTNGNLLRIFSNNGLYLRDASIIEQLWNIDHIVFDKTGTLTSGGEQFIFSGHQLTDEEKDIVYSAAVSSKHPYSQALVNALGIRRAIPLVNWKETHGAGLQANAGDCGVLIGSGKLTGITNHDPSVSCYIRLGDRITAFTIVPAFRNGVTEIIQKLQRKYELSLLSGDSEKQRQALRKLFKKDGNLLFGQQPADKLSYIERLQRGNKNVLMVGDGLNDAGALQQSNVGITLADDINNFTPSCDAILDARQFSSFPALLQLAYRGKIVIYSSFIVSILYNIVGLTISVQAKMNPMIAAILMPVSTVSIVLITTGVTSLIARRLSLKS